MYIIAIYELVRVLNNVALVVVHLLTIVYWRSVPVR